MTAVMNLELAHLKRMTEIQQLRNETTHLRNNAMAIHVQLIELRTELLTNRIIRPERTLRSIGSQTRIEGRVDALRSIRTGSQANCCVVSGKPKCLASASS